MAAKKTTKDKDIDKVAQDKSAALETVLAKIERDCGKGSIMRLGDNAAMNVSAVSTGSLSLDFALGIGGIPRGRITEIYGPESSGKTPSLFTLLLRLRSRAVRRRSSMLSTLSILSMRRSLELISMSFSFLSPTAASRLLKLPRHSFVRVL